MLEHIVDARTHFKSSFRCSSHFFNIFNNFSLFLPAVFKDSRLGGLENFLGHLSVVSLALVCMTSPLLWELLWAGSVLSLDMS